MPWSVNSSMVILCLISWFPLFHLTPTILIMNYKKIILIQILKMLTSLLLWVIEKMRLFFNKAGINNDFYLKKNALFKIGTVSGLSSPSLKYWLTHILAEGTALSVITLSLTDRRSSEEIYQQRSFVCLFVFSFTFRSRCAL